jgi:hypothetical protein
MTAGAGPGAQSTPGGLDRSRPVQGLVASCTGRVQSTRRNLGRR